jgi:HPt (histidine-containing phosphotransfer) domain-containing protein
MLKNYTFLEDTDSVLERLGGNEALFLSLLLKFRDTYRDTRSKILRFLSTAETEEAYRIVHSIKGVAGNLGIGALYRDAVALETKMKAGDYSADQPELEVFISVMEKVLDEMDEKKAGDGN